MKSTVLIVSLLILASSVALAAGPQGNSNSNAGSGNVQVTSVQGTGNGTQANVEVKTQIQTQVKIKSGNYTVGGRQLKVQKQTNNRIQLRMGNASTETFMELIQEEVQNKTKIKANLSNGRNAEIKIMPDTASERALERLRLRVCSPENNCTIVLKEVGQGNETKAAYEVQVQKQARILALFKTKMKVMAQVDAENGQIIQTKRPWWAFLAAETAE